jgi:hypothetical protein
MVLWDVTMYGLVNEKPSTSIFQAQDLPKKKWRQPVPQQRKCTPTKLYSNYRVEKHNV